MIKNILTMIIILLFMGMSVIPSTGTVVEKKSIMLTFYDGDTLYVGGDGSGNYSKIQDDIDDAINGEMYFEDVDVLIIGRCRTIGSDGRWQKSGALYIGNLTIAELGIGTKLQRVHVIVYNETLYDSFIRFANGTVCMRNASGIFFWGGGASKSGVSFISPIVFIRCHTDRLWIRGNDIPLKINAFSEMLVKNNGVCWI